MPNRAKINKLYGAPMPYDPHALKGSLPGVSVWNPEKDIVVVHRAVESVLMLNFYIPMHLMSTSLTKRFGNEVRFLITIDFGVN